MLEIAIGSLTTLVGVLFGCIVMELAMRALKHSLRSLSYEQTGEQVVAWEGEQIPARVSTFVRGDHA